MKFVSLPRQLLLLIVAGWINHRERNPQGLNNQLLQPGKAVGCAAGDKACWERVGGMPRYYCRLPDLLLRIGAQQCIAG